MPGFDFSNHTRNAALHARGVPLPKATSTGTTIVGCMFEGGVVVRALILYLYSQQHKLTLCSTDRRRHQSHLRPHRRRQELRKAALHLPPNLVRRRRYRSRHRIHHLHHQFPTRAARPVHRPQAPRRHLHDNAQAAPLQVPRPHWSVPCCCWC